jgi:DNA-binding NarL/FixJ family response regulator
MSANAPLAAPARPVEYGALAPGRLRPLSGTVDRESPGLTALDARAAPPAVGGETPIRVLIAAGQALLRAGYRAVLERNEAIEVVAEAASGQQALELAAATTPDIALLDVELPGLDVTQTTAAIVSRPAVDRVAVMVIALNESDERVLSALRAGAIGMLSNDAGPADLIRALEVLASGQALFPAGAVRRLLAELPPPPDHACRAMSLDELTSREQEVMALVAKGLSNAEIAARLVISPATAKTHVSRILYKLQVRDRAKLVILAYEAGLVAAHREAAPPGPSNAIL